jgi:glyoxylase-like metal-dependent hydrolase (beta-lactamase superfamily II)
VKIETFVVGVLQNNCYLIADEVSGRTAAIDPGLESEPLREAVGAAGLDLACLILTHAHFDHVAGCGLFPGVPIVMHPDDLPLLQRAPETARLFGYTIEAPPAPTRLVREGDSIALGGVRLQVLETPGHTPGGISLVAGDAVFVGDTLFAGSIGRTDLAGGSYETLLRSIRAKLLPLPDATVVYPGHGPATTIGQERRDNPFLRREA